MSLTERIKQGYLRLSGPEKAILIGSGLTMLAPLLPWYDSMKGYISETIMGISGPLFLVGVFTMIFGALTFFQLFLPMIGKSLAKRDIAQLANFCGFQAVLMLIISNSVFFNPDYGVSVTHKGTRFGMFFAFTGAALMIIGAYFSKKRAERTDFSTRTLSDSQVQSYSAPLQNPMDARAKYKAVSSSARANLWQKHSGGNTYATPFSRLDAVEREVKEIRTDL